MNILDFIRHSTQLYYVRADIAGRFVDIGELLRIHLNVIGASDSKLDALTTSRGVRILRAAADRARRSDWPVSFQIPMKQHDGTAIITAWEIAFNDGEYEAIGFDLFKLDTPDSLKLRKQSKILREIAWIQSHLVRRPVANILGLAPLAKRNALTDEDKRVLEMLDQATKELDEIIQKITRLTQG